MPYNNAYDNQPSHSVRPPHMQTVGRNENQRKVRTMHLIALRKEEKSAFLRETEPLAGESFLKPTALNAGK